MNAAYKTIFDNSHFIIVDKAPMVLSVPSRLGAKDERRCLGHILQSDLNCQIYPVHRLDYEVSGLIMFAKTPEAHRAGNAWFENKMITKTYVALTSGENAPSEKIHVPFEWTCSLLRGKKRAYESAQGKTAVTQGALIEKLSDGNFRWHLNPVTGRSHQLRYELYRHGHPIIGDELYGSTLKFSSTGIALRAFEINFEKILERTKFNLPEKISILEL
jgi:tRNA pseudouridine32 synthase/23S rRNA pseudouridine746 synthase